jgi:hypothetical protein
MDQRHPQLCTLIAALAIGCAVLVLAAPYSNDRGSAWSLSGNVLHQATLSHATHASGAKSILSVPAAATSTQRRASVLPQHYAGLAPAAPLLPVSFQRPPPFQRA